MPVDKIPDLVRRFVFDHIDSVEQLEVLLHLWRGRGRAFSAEQIDEVLRTNPASVGQRLEGLVQLGLAVRTGDEGSRRYEFNASPQSDELLETLAETYRVRRYSVLELMFSPLKRARTLANAFRLTGPKKGGDGADS